MGRTAASPEVLACTKVDSGNSASVFAGSKGQPISIVTTTKHTGKIVTRPAIGVSSFVVAEPGVTRAYLERIAVCEASSLSARTGVAHAAQVEEVVGGYRVALTTRDSRAATALVRYAKSAQERATRTEGGQESPLEL